MTWNRLARWALAVLGRAALVVVVTASVVFGALHLAGGDPVEAVLGGPGSQAGPEAVAAARAQYGLDQPLLMQYLRHLRNVLTLDLGDSFARRMPVADLLWANVPPTAVLAVTSLALAWALALLLAGGGHLATGRTARAVRGLLRGAEVTASVLPHFLLGAVAIVVFAAWLGWLPATSAPGSLIGLVLPAFTLAIPLAGFLANVLREGLLEADSAPFATSARARGLSGLGVLARHTLRHAALPAVALSGWAFGSLLSGAVVVEVLFGRPGLGRLLVDAALVRDVPVVIGAVVVVALGYVVVTALVDLLELALDPRLRAPVALPDPARPVPA